MSTAKKPPLPPITDEMKQGLAEGQAWRHYSNGCTYEVEGFRFDAGSSTAPTRLNVDYRCIASAESDNIGVPYTRPVSEFVGRVQDIGPGGHEGYSGPRFTKVEHPDGDGVARMNRPQKLKVIDLRDRHHRGALVMVVVRTGEMAGDEPVFVQCAALVKVWKAEDERLPVLYIEPPQGFVIANDADEHPLRKALTAAAGEAAIAVIERTDTKARRFGNDERAALKKGLHALQAVMCQVPTPDEPDFGRYWPMLADHVATAAGTIVVDLQKAFEIDTTDTDDVAAIMKVVDEAGERYEKAMVKERAPQMPESSAAREALVHLHAIANVLGIPAQQRAANGQSIEGFILAIRKALADRPVTPRLEVDRYDGHDLHGIAALVMNAARQGGNDTDILAVIDTFCREHKMATPREKVEGTEHTDQKAGCDLGYTASAEFPRDAFSFVAGALSGRASWLRNHGRKQEAGVMLQIAQNVVDAATAILDGELTPDCGERPATPQEVVDDFTPAAPADVGTPLTLGLFEKALATSEAGDVEGAYDGLRTDLRNEKGIPVAAERLVDVRDVDALGAPNTATGRTTVVVVSPPPRVIKVPGVYDCGACFDTRQKQYRLTDSSMPCPKCRPSVDLATIDAGVRDIVAKLIAEGIKTTDSGDGTKSVEDMPCSMPFAHVFARTSAEEVADDVRIARECIPADWRIEVQYSDAPDDGVWALMMVSPGGYVHPSRIEKAEAAVDRLKARVTDLLTSNNELLERSREADREGARTRLSMKAVEEALRVAKLAELNWMSEAAKAQAKAEVSEVERREARIEVNRLQKLVGDLKGIAEHASTSRACLLYDETLQTRAAKVLADMGKGLSVDIVSKLDLLVEGEKCSKLVKLMKMSGKNDPKVKRLLELGFVVRPTKAPRLLAGTPSIPGEGNVWKLVTVGTGTEEVGEVISVVDATIADDELPFIAEVLMRLLAQYETING